MFRLLVFFGVIAALGASGYTALEKRRQPPAPPAAAIERFLPQIRTAEATLERARSLIGTYELSDLSVFRGLTVAWADSTSYCFHVVRGSEVFHLKGPGGQPAEGPCRR